MFEPTLCIYHGNCADGFTAAWAVRRKFPEIRFVPGIYGKPPPDVEGESVLLVDFSYDEQTLLKMLTLAEDVFVLDHHKTAEAALRPLLDSGIIGGQFDMDRSGAMMAWQYFHPDTKVPTLVEHVQDRDLWRFNMPGTRVIQACMFSYPYQFDVWDHLVGKAETLGGWMEMFNEGAAIERKHHKDIEELLNESVCAMVIGGHLVPVANLPYTMASDAAHILADSPAPFGACYFDRHDCRVFSLRSRKDGADVSAIAKLYGGGGHKHAAGFQRPRGWEGDNVEGAAKALAQDDFLGQLQQSGLRKTEGGY